MPWFEDLTRVPDAELPVVMERLNARLREIGVFSGILDDRVTMILTELIFLQTKRLQREEHQRESAQWLRQLPGSPREHRRLRTRYKRLQAALDAFEAALPADAPYDGQIYELSAEIESIFLMTDSAWAPQEAPSVPPKSRSRMTFRNSLMDVFLILHLTQSDASRRIARIENNLWDGNIAEEEDVQRRSPAITKSIARSKKARR